MRELHLDLIILFIYCMSNTLYYIWALIYPYLASYLKYENNDITMKYVFATTISMFVGITLGNMILPYFYFLFGIKTTIQIGGVLNFINCIFYYLFTSKIGLLLNVAFTGVVYQFCILSVNYYLSEKYQKGFIYCNYVLVGQNIANVFWPFFSVFLINPSNLGMTVEFGIGNDKELFFPEEIAHKFPRLITIIGLVSMILVILPSIFLKDPEHIEPHFKMWGLAILKLNKESLKELSQMYKDQSIKMETSSIINQSLSKSIFIKEELLEEEKNLMNYEEAVKISKKIMLDPLFLVFLVVIAFRQAPLGFLIDNYKLIAFQVICNDQKSSIALSLSSLFSMLGQLIIPSIWNKFDFYYSNLIVSFLIIFGNIIYLIYAVESSFFMFWILIFLRIVTEMNYGVNHLTKFGLFPPQVAVHISKMFDNNYLLSMIITISFNYLFFSQSDIETIFWIFGILNIFFTFVLVFYFKNFQTNINDLLKNFN